VVQDFTVKVRLGFSLQKEVILVHRAYLIRVFTMAGLSEMFLA
jgi:hypothetical protein